MARYRTRISHRALEEWMREAALTADERTLVEAMYTEMERAAAKASAEVRAIRAEREEWNRRREEIHPALRDQSETYQQPPETQQLFRVWMQTRPKIEDQFERDVAALLSGEKLRSWIDFSRRLRRERMVDPRSSDPFNQRPIDLIAIVGEIELNEESRAKIEPMLEEYAARLDEMLRDFYLTRDLAIARSFEVRARWRANPDDRTLQRERERINAKIDGLMNGPHRLNEEYTLLIAAELLPEEGRRFLDQVDVWTYPDLFMQSPAALAIERLPEVEWLNPGQREQIDAIAERFVRNLERVNRRIVRLYKSGSLGENRQTLRARLNAEGNWPPPVWPPEDDPEVELRRERYLLARAAMRRLRALFTDEEYEALPADLRLLLSW